MTSATALDASEAGERADLGRLASPLFPQDRETSANPFGNFSTQKRESSEASFSHFRTCTETSMAGSQNKRKSSRDMAVVRDSQLEREKILSEQREIFTISSRGMRIKPFEENVRLRQDCLKHNLNWTDENGRCRVLTELFMNQVSNFILRGWNFTK